MRSLGYVVALMVFGTLTGCVSETPATELGACEAAVETMRECTTESVVPTEQLDALSALECSGEWEAQAQQIAGRSCEELDAQDQAGEESELTYPCCCVPYTRSTGTCSWYCRFPLYYCR